jgi:hypothetical protein
MPAFEELIELTVDSPDGVVDCRLDLVVPEEGEEYYTATILYPNTINGFSRSEIFVYDLKRDADGDSYSFQYGDEGIHPKIMKLEGQLSEAINKAQS